MDADDEIVRLDLADRTTATEILGLQRRAYRMEADLIGFDGIPPLHENLDELVARPVQWSGIRRGGRVVAAMAVTGEGHACDIDRLVVDPAQQRRGLARRLVASTLISDVVTVSTGTGNTPAVALYESLGFTRAGEREIAPGVTVTEYEHRNTRARSSFDADVDNYERARPPYPAAILDHVIRTCGIVAGTRVLEMGAGAGLATMPLLDAGAHVLAVEPGPNMAARLRERTRGRRCTVVEATFEQADLDVDLDGDVDVAVAATSFHWIDASVALAKLARLVRPDGWLALWWNVHRRADDTDDDLADGITAIASRYQTRERRDAIAHAFDVEARRAEIATGGHFEVVEHRVATWTHTHDAASLRGLFASYSDWSTLPEPDRTHALDAIAALVEARGGSVTRTYSTALYLARPTRRGFV